MSDRSALIQDLLAIHSRAGTEVTYVADSGETRAYWPNRYLQAAKRAIGEGPNAVVDFVTQLVERPEPSRGFGYLQAAGRLDLTVEALVVNEAKPYHHLFSAATIDAAARRLSEHGWVADSSQDPNRTESPEPIANTNSATGVPSAVPFTASWGQTLKLAGKVMTLTGTAWYLLATAGLRPDEVAELNNAVLHHCQQHQSPQIGGNHVLEALLSTGLYQRT